TEKREVLLVKKVLKTEEELSRSSLKDATSHQEVFDIHLGREAVANTLREFYHSPAFIKKRRTKEIQAKKFKDRIASKERKYVIGSDPDKKIRKQLMMMIGDRGTGVGSTIRG
ncbi:hypothetical protein K501DRAFT_300815, partial [Backusella circina FSU 941]